MRQLLLPALIFILSATAHAAVQDPHKVCTARYDAEKASGTIPVGMSKATYIRQCAGSIRRAAKLEQELAAGTGARTQDDGTQPGSNEVTASAATVKPAATTAKPARIKTALTPRGY